MEYCQNIYKNYILLVGQARNVHEKIFDCMHYVDLRGMNKFVTWFV
jgi:hypothetical protein